MNYRNRLTTALLPALALMPTALAVPSAALVAPSAALAVRSAALLVPSAALLVPSAALALLPTTLSAQVGALLELKSSPWMSQLPAGPNTTMGSKLEKTILSVDVLNLTLRVDAATAGQITQAIDGIEKYDDDHEDTVAEIAIATEVAVAEIVFMRGVRLDQFLDGVSEDMMKAVDVGWLKPETFVLLRDSLPVWFSFLEERKIQDGDRLQYHIRGDTLRTVFWGIDEDENLLDQTDIGRQRVMALLGAYFAPKSSFRKELVESLWKGWDATDP